MEATNMYKTINVTINGEVKEIIPAIPAKSRELKELKTNSIENKVKSEYYLPRIYNFNAPDDFYANDIELYSCVDGSIIEKGTENVHVLIPTAETVKLFLQSRIFENELLEVRFHNYGYEEYYKVLASNEVMIKSASNLDYLNWTAIITKNEYLLNLSRFIEEYDMPLTTGERYFNAVLSNSKIRLASIVGKIQDVESRTYEVAERLYQLVYTKVGKSDANKRYLIGEINRKVAEGFDLEDIMKAVDYLDFVAIRAITSKGIGCLDKEECIASEITSAIYDLGIKPRKKNIDENKKEKKSKKAA